jgi:hypothetical protein
MAIAFSLSENAHKVLEEVYGNANMEILLPRQDTEKPFFVQGVLAHHIMLGVGVLESRAEKQPMGSEDGRLMRYQYKHCLDNYVLYALHAAVHIVR